MKAKLTICIVTLTLAFCSVSKVCACCEDPIANMVEDPDPVCVYCPIEFDATASYDPDCSSCQSCCGVNMINGIRKFEWDWTNNGSYDHSESPGDGEASHIYSAAGSYTCKLRVTDDDADCCCSGAGCADKTDTMTVAFRVVEVDKVVENVSPYTNEGPLYRCRNSTVSLKALANPSGSFPDGEPHWTVESEPSGANATLTPSSGSATTTLGGLTKSGEYVIKAKCGSSDTGDTITVKVETPLVNETDWLLYPDADLPNCPPILCDGEDLTIFDDCGNELELSCAQKDGTGGPLGCAYRYFYNDNLISSCIWEGGINKWWYKEATVGTSSLKVFTKARHGTCDPDKYDDEGCDGYHCALVTIYDCRTGESTPYWRRDPYIEPLDEDDGEEEDGHPEQLK